MFGNKKSKIIEEQNRAFLSQMAEKKEGFDADLAQIEEAGKRIHTDICQVMENSNSLVENAMLNIEEESKLIHAVDDFSRELKQAVEEYMGLKELIEKQFEATTALVEENKHYTTPAKYLTETPANMRSVSKNYIQELETMEEDGRRMGVLALNSAIEAGRMGEIGKQFVAASEEIRQYAIAFEKKAVSMREELERSESRIDELEEIVGRLVALMKENNMGTTRLLKKSQETKKAVEQSSMREFSEDMIQLRDKVVGMRNLDEEIAKCGERNKIQLSDIQEDVQSQKQQLAELESDISYMFDILEEQLH